MGFFEEAAQGGWVGAVDDALVGEEGLEGGADAQFVAGTLGGLGAVASAGASGSVDFFASVVVVVG